MAENSVLGSGKRAPGGFRAEHAYRQAVLAAALFASVAVVRAGGPYTIEYELFDQGGTSSYTAGYAVVDTISVASCSQEPQTLSGLATVWPVLQTGFWTTLASPVWLAVP